MIDLTINEKNLEKAVGRARERNIIIPTFRQQKDPRQIPELIKKSLRSVSLWDINSTNLFRITWKNEPVERGGGFGSINHMEVPSIISGVMVSHRIT